MNQLWVGFGSIRIWFESSLGREIAGLIEFVLTRIRINPAHLLGLVRALKNRSNFDAQQFYAILQKKLESILSSKLQVRRKQKFKNLKKTVKMFDDICFTPKILYIINITHIYFWRVIPFSPKKSIYSEPEIFISLDTFYLKLKLNNN